MSSAAPHGGATASSSAAVTVTRYYFCHQCCLAAATAADAACPLCHGHFLEEIDLPLCQNPSDPFFAICSLSLSPAAFVLRSPADAAALFHSDISPLHSQFSFRTLSEHRINKLLSLGARVHAVVVGVPPPPPDDLSGPPTGEGLCDFGNQVFDDELAEGPDFFGVPAAGSAIAALPEVEMAGGEGPCAVCQETFTAGGGATRFPCNHVFHRDCILPWLGLRNTCPECRFELQTEDEDAGGLGITAVFVIVMLPLSWDDPPQRTATVERSVPGRLIPQQ